MTMGRWAALLGVVGVGVVLGCGPSSECNVTPNLAQAPSCTLAPDALVTVSARWCSCNATITCDPEPDFGSGLINLQPKVASCDATCEPNPSSCDPDVVQCRFTTPAVSGNYTMYFGTDLGTEQRSLTISAGGGTSCGPG
jgi:hypothetical protein